MGKIKFLKNIKLCDVIIIKNTIFEIDETTDDIELDIKVNSINPNNKNELELTTSNEYMFITKNMFEQLLNLNIIQYIE